MTRPIRQSYGFPANDRPITLGGFLAIERRIRGQSPRSRRPAAAAALDLVEAERVLASLAKSVKPGSRVSIAEVAGVGGCTEYFAARVRHWARSCGRWPYLNGSAPFGRRPQGGEP